MPAYTVTNWHFATGEGMTRWLLYVYAENEQAALDEFKRRVGDYFIMGAEVKSGFDLECGAAALLLPPAVRQLLEPRDFGNAVYFAELHLNYS